MILTLPPYYNYKITLDFLESLRRAPYKSQQTRKTTLNLSVQLLKAFIHSTDSLPLRTDLPPILVPSQTKNVVHERRVCGTYRRRFVFVSIEVCNSVMHRRGRGRINTLLTILTSLISSVPKDFFELKLNRST